MTQTNPLKALMNSAEVCEALNIDRSTLSRKVAAGQIAFVTKLPGLRGAYLFDRAEVERFKDAA